jgi:GT2 family glycosyltransferase
VHLATPITVVIVNHSRSEMLYKCLQSLTGQTFPHFHVVLVDNASIDDSVVKANDFSQNDKFSLELVQNETNRGFCAANNQGIARARSEFVALLNNDAEADPGWLAELHRALSSRPDFGMAASKILVHSDPRRIDKAAHLIYWDRQNRGRGSGEEDRGQFDREEEALWPDGCAALYRKAMLEEIGGFDEDLFAYGDDAELGMRARLAGWRCIYVPTATVRHHRGATLGLHSRRRLELIERNRVLLAVKHFPLSLLLLNPLFFLIRILASVWAAARGKGEVGRFPGLSGKLVIFVAILRADLEAIRMIPNTWAKRKRFRTLRRLSSRETTRLLKQYQISLRELTEQAI